MQFSLSMVARVLDQVVPAVDQSIHDVVIDSRITAAQDLFVAIKGASFDGHDFVMQAVANGAIAVVVERPLEAEIPSNIVVFQVPNTREALGKLASAYRQLFNIPFIAITGSCGKTSTKTLAAHVLSQKGKTLATIGTLNNDIGVPLTLFRLTAEDQFAVLELGANHVGEIDYLSKIVLPTVAAITNTGPVHLEGFGSIEGVRKGKGEIYENLSEDGIGIVNLDDEGARQWLEVLSGKSIITIGIANKADIYATDITLNENLQASFSLHIKNQFLKINLPLIGVHQVYNALIAAAVGVSQGLNLDEIQAGLESTPLVEKRGVMQKGYHRAWLIDDSYNANPKAFNAAIKLLMSAKQVRQHILVMGDMGELGEDSWSFHAEVGAFAKQSGVTALYAVGNLSRAACESFGANAFHFPDQDSLIQALKHIADADVCFLIKGSNSSRMENVVKALIVE